MELAYATTAYGVQGATADTAHVVIGEHTGAAAAYVGMTRGRRANTADLIAADLDEAREQWVTMFARDRADLGPEHARRAAEHAAGGYAEPRPVSQIIDALRREWDSEAADVGMLAWAVPLRDDLSRIALLQRRHVDEITPLDERYARTRDARSLAHARADHSESIIAAETVQHREALLADWNAQRGEARANARRVLDGPGRLGFKWSAVNRANEALARWAVTWQPIIPAMPTEHAEIARFADRADDTPRIYTAVHDYAYRQAERRHPEHEHHVAAATAADRAAQQASIELFDARGRHRQGLGYYGRLGDSGDPDERLGQIERHIASSQQRLTATRERITHLVHSLAAAPQDEVGGQAEPATVSPIGLGQPTDPVEAARTQWWNERATAHQAARREAAHHIAAFDRARDQERCETWRRHGAGPTQARPEHDIAR